MISRSEKSPFVKKNPIIPNGQQRQTVLKHLIDLGSLSGLEATALYRVSSLSGVMSRLKRCGWDIKSEWRYDHTGKRYVRYVLSQVP